MEELSLDNIQDGDFLDSLVLNDEPSQETEENDAPDNKEKEKEPDTTEVNAEEYFVQNSSESVGSEDNKEKEDAANEGSDSPSFYSSIANALIEDGIFQNLDEEQVKKVKTAEDFADLIDSHIKNQLDDRQKRIDEALGLGIEPSEIQKYESYIRTLDSISEEKIEEEDEQGETLRKNLIYQDFINKGFSKEKATKYLERSLKAGTDIEDAKEALQSNKDFFKEQYNNLIKEAKEEEKKERERH